MISRSDLECIAQRPAKAGECVLSVYLDVDSSRLSNLNRGFEVTLRSLLHQKEQQLSVEQERQDFRQDAAPLFHFLESYRPQAKSLICFSNTTDGFFWQRESQIPVSSQIHWLPVPFLRPILATFDGCRRYGIVLADKAQARAFTVYLGQLQKHFTSLASATVKHIKKTGSDHSRSQMQLQRKSDLHALWHLKRVAEMTDHLMDSQPFDHLILAGPAEATAILHRQLPHRLESRLVATVPLPADASPQQVLEAAVKVQSSVEPGLQMTLVEELLGSAEKHSKHVTGVTPTLTALYQDQIHRLVHAEDWNCPGSYCPSCRRLYEARGPSCGQCHLPLQAVEDLVEEMSKQVLVSGGKVEEVRDGAAKKLNQEGGIGAILRFSNSPV